MMPVGAAQAAEAVGERLLTTGHFLHGLQIARTAFLFNPDAIPNQRQSRRRRGIADVDTKGLSRQGMEGKQPKEDTKLHCFNLNSKKTVAVITGETSSYLLENPTKQEDHAKMIASLEAGT